VRRRELQDEDVAPGTTAYGLSSDLCISTSNDLNSRDGSRRKEENYTVKERPRMRRWTRKKRNILLGNPLGKISTGDLDNSLSNQMSAGMKLSV
jgi:hypothetical protein